ncbi:dienelactone hydrolase family protein [Botryobacter ruber]|uniref:dienelactone hydrolase family protein n=1 Tax=Botryobacter ruber TaxID=2171629 RepID=UPI000E0AABCB|nr:dienelactone hydrolase family protein [Botryobacter ruber]
MKQFVFKDSVRIDVKETSLVGELAIPENAKGLILFVQDDPSTEVGKSHAAIAERLNKEGFATLLFDLLDPEEEKDYENHLDIPLMTEHIINTVYWVEQDDVTKDLNLGLVGSERGAAAALSAAAALGDIIKAVVAVAGRADLASPTLSDLQAPALLLVPGKDEALISFNQEAHDQIEGIRDMQLVPDATAAFKEPGALEMAANLVDEWFKKYLEPGKLHPLHQNQP